MIRPMVVGARRTRSVLLLAGCLLAALVLMGLGAGQASADVNATAGASNCDGASCSNFRVTMWGSTIAPNKSGKICFKGKCLSVQSNSVGVFYADFNVTGPYKNGSKTSASLSYKGRKYNRNVWIDCGC